MQTFPFAFDPRWRGPLRLVGVTPDNSSVVLTDAELDVTFGRWRLRTAVENLTEVRVTGPYRTLKVIGPHVSLADRGVTFGTNSERGVCVLFRDPVGGIDPAGLIRHPGATVTVADPTGLAQAVQELIDTRSGGGGQPLER